jgi:enamine deaminase RidA (YjgF/YER057c/UK114 family)
VANRQRRALLRLGALAGFGGLVARSGPSGSTLARPVHGAAEQPMSIGPALKQGEGEAVELEVTHLSPEGMHQNPAYSQAVTVTGNARTIYIGGQNAVDAQGQVVGKGDIAAQTEQIFANLETVLTAAGARLHDVIKWTVYIVQGTDFMPGFAVFQQKWGTAAPPPIVTAAIVAGLAHPDFLVEIEAVAVVRSDG